MSRVRAYGHSGEEREAAAPVEAPTRTIADPRAPHLSPATVLALQRSIGNRGAARLVEAQAGRSRAADREDLPVALGGQLTGPRTGRCSDRIPRRPRQHPLFALPRAPTALRVRNVSGPTPADCGAFTWQVNFRLESAITGGWLLHPAPQDPPKGEGLQRRAGARLEPDSRLLGGLARTPRRGRGRARGERNVHLRRSILARCPGTRHEGRSRIAARSGSTRA